MYRADYRDPFVLVLGMMVVAVCATVSCGGNNGGGTTASPQPPTTSSPSPSPPSSPAPAAPPTIQISASPSSIPAGQSATLSWNTTNATTVSIQPGSSNLPASGSLTVTPSSTTTYTATATGASGSATAQATVTVTSATSLGFAFGHVAIVALENKNYSTVVGNTSAMPYLNSLITNYGLGTNYYANTHPSIGNYFMLTTGQIITNDDSFSGVVSADNVVRELVAAGKSWRSYAEDLPYDGYLGGDTGLYVRRHNPFTFFSDAQNDPAMATASVVQFSQLASDMASGNLPQYTFIVPNIDDDAHECPNDIDACEAVADAWLQTNIAPLLASSTFANDGVLIVWFDESENDNTNGGGKVAIVFISPAWSKHGYRSTTFGQHQNTLRFTMDALGVSSVPGAGAGATGWNEFFNAH